MLSAIHKLSPTQCPKGTTQDKRDQKERPCAQRVLQGIHHSTEIASGSKRETKQQSWFPLTSVLRRIETAIGKHPPIDDCDQRTVSQEMLTNRQANK
jgi:hypothetical protein